MSQEAKTEAEKPARSASQIEADLQATRAELEETVAALTDKLNPKAQLDQLGESVKNTAEKGMDEAKKIVEGAKKKDPRSLAILGGVGAAVALAAGLVVMGIVRRSGK